MQFARNVCILHHGGLAAPERGARLALRPCAANRPGGAPVLQTRPQLNRHSYSLFTRQIRGCTDWNELRSLFLKQREQLNTINLLALVHQLTQVLGRKSMAKFEDSGRHAFVMHVVDDLSQSRHMDNLELRGTANLLWGLGRLGYNPGATWMDHMLMHMLRQLQASNRCSDPISLSQALWATAKLGHAPPVAWLDAFFPAVIGCLHTMSPQALANVLWAMAVLQAPPSDPGFWPTFYKVSSLKMHSFAPQGLSNMLWALATLGIQPPCIWFDCFWQAVMQAIPRFQPLDTSHVLWGCARLRLDAPPKVFKALLLNSRPKMRHFGTQEMANALWALTTLRVPVKQIWLLAACERAKRCMVEFKPQELATLVWAMAHLAEQHDGWSSVDRIAPAFFSASLPSLQFFNSQDLVSTLWGISRLHWAPPEVWIQALHEHAFSLLPYLEPQQYVYLMCSLADLRACPSKTWMARLFQATLPHLPAYSALDLAWLVMACASLSAQPPRSWMEQLLRALQMRMSEASPPALCIMARALVRLKYSPGLAWRQAFEVRVCQVLAALPKESAPPELGTSKGRQQADEPAQPIGFRLLGPPLAVASRGKALAAPPGAGAAEAKSSPPYLQLEACQEQQQQQQLHSHMPHKNVLYDSRVQQEAYVLRRALRALGHPNGRHEGMC